MGLWWSLGQYRILVDFIFTHEKNDFNLFYISVFFLKVIKALVATFKSCFLTFKNEKQGKCM